jgi:four helix bundle protein
MASYQSYKDLDVWKKARQLVHHVYEMTKKFPKDEVYGLTSQIRRAAVSVPSNIAEGTGRQFRKETLQFVHIARGSLFELETQFYLALDLGYISETEAETILTEIVECCMLVTGFANYLQKATLK